MGNRVVMTLNLKLEFNDIISRFSELCLEWVEIIILNYTNFSEE